MRCPCCGASGFKPATFMERMIAQRWKILGLIVAVCGAFYGQAEMIGEPWHHYISIISIGGTAALAWNIKPQEKEIT